MQKQKFGYKEYQAIKELLEKYNITFDNYLDYEKYIRDLTNILRI